MTVQPQAPVYPQAFGTYTENVEIPVISTSLPPTIAARTIYPIGKRWIDQTTNTIYTLTSITPSPNGVTTYNWQVSTGSITGVNTISGNSGTATPTAGNIAIDGSNLTSTASGSTVTLSVPDPFTPLDVIVSANATIRTLSSASNATIGGNLSSTGASINLGTNSSTVNFDAGSVIINANAMTMTSGLDVHTNAVPNNYVMTAADCYIGCNTFASPITVYLPASPSNGQMIYVCDTDVLAGTNNITINGNGKLIVTAGSSPLPTTVINTNSGTCFLIYNSSGWNVIARS